MSDSNEDIFGNAAENLKILCSRSYNKKIDHCEVLSDSPEFDKRIECVSPSKSVNNLFSLGAVDINKYLLFKKNISTEPDYPSDLSDESDEWFEHRTAKRRQSAKKSKRGSLKKTVSKKPAKVTKISDSNTNNSPLKGVQPKRKKQRRTKSPQDVLSQPLSDRLVSEGPNGNKNFSDTNRRNNLSESIENIHTSVSRGRSRVLRDRRRKRPGLRPQSTSQYTTISIGNTAEYPDNSEDIPLFSSKPNIPQEIVIDDNEILDDNEEVCVHVHWQSYKVFKFNLRKFQKLKKIFDFFAEKENVSEKRLYFEYDNVVLTSNDSPDSIKYNIAKFIEGGLNSEDFEIPVIELNKPGGINIKFQCQNIKRPYESTVQLDEKLSLVMVKCAEHFEKPLYNLKFEFDGERIIGDNTARQLELESGDCIDVKIIK